MEFTENENFRQTLDMKETGFHLRKLREERNLSVATVADHLGISQQAVYNWEIGSTDINIRHLISVCCFYKVTLDDVVKQMPEKCCHYDE